MMTAVLAASGRANSAFSSVVLPLPRKPVITVTGIRLRRGSRPVLTVIPSALEIHFKRVEAPGKTVDGIDDTAIIDKNVVELDRARARHLRCARHEVRDLLRLVRIGQVVDTQPA